MNRKTPPRLVSVSISAPLTKSQRADVPMAPGKPKKPAPLVFTRITRKPSKGGLSRLLYDFETVRRAKALTKSLGVAFPL